MQLKKDILGEIFFTEYDKGITGTSMRDPLGLQPIWSYYGRQVVNHLTTISTDIRGFREVLLCLSICSACKNKHKTETYKNLILLFEQLFIYSAIDNGMIEGIIGADNGAAKFRNASKNPIISINSGETILVREISLGYYGRYKTPLSTMKVITSDSSVVQSIDVMNLYGSKRYNKILDAFDSFVSLRESERQYRQFTALNEMFEAVCGKFRAGEREFWLEKLQIDGAEKQELMSSCYNLISDERSPKNVLDELCDIDEVKDVERLEPFLRCMEFIFFQALSVKNLSNIVLDDVILDEHKKRYDKFAAISDAKNANSELLYKRMKYIKENCSPYKSDYVKNVIEYHKLVCDQKRSSVWIESDASGNVQAFIQPDIAINIDDWGRDYYLSSLHSIKNGIEELSL